MLLLLIIGLFLVQDTYSCKGGGGSGCCRRRQSTYIQPSCTSGCQPGYSCGSYGCAKRRALGGLTKRIDGILVAEEEGEQAYTLPLERDVIADVSNINLTLDRLTNPNFIFHSCCQMRGLPDACLRHCHFNTYSAKTLERMFHQEDECPIETANEIHFCAAQGLDHTKCCASEGVAATLAGRKCLAFCDQRPNRFTALDMSYLPCMSVFENMKRCFYQEIRFRAEEKFGLMKVASHENF